MQAACGIEQQHIDILQFRGFERAARDIDGLLAGHDGQGRNVGLLTQHGELFLRCRTVDVERGHQRLLALLVLQQLGDLGGAGGFTRTLQADHHHHGGRIDVQIEWRRFTVGLFAAQHLHQLVIDDLDDLLARRHRFEHFLPNGALGYAVDEFLGDGQRDICFQQGNAHFAHCVAHVLFAQRPAAAQAVKDIVQTVRQRIEHALLLLLT